MADFEAFKFNTVIAGLMEYTNELAKAWDAGGVSPDTWRESIQRILLILAPIAPHITEELWERTPANKRAVGYLATHLCLPARRGRSLAGALGQQSVQRT